MLKENADEASTHDREVCDVTKLHHGVRNLAAPQRYKPFPKPAAPPVCIIHTEQLGAAGEAGEGSGGGGHRELRGQQRSYEVLGARRHTKQIRPANSGGGGGSGSNAGRGNNGTGRSNQNSDSRSAPAAPAQDRSAAAQGANSLPLGDRSTNAVGKNAGGGGFNAAVECGHCGATGHSIHDSSAYNFLQSWIEWPVAPQCAFTTAALKPPTTCILTHSVGRAVTEG